MPTKVSKERIYNISEEEFYVMAEDIYSTLLEKIANGDSVTIDTTNPRNNIYEQDAVRTLEGLGFVLGYDEEKSRQDIENSLEKGHESKLRKLIQYFRAGNSHCRAEYDSEVYIIKHINDLIKQHGFPEYMLEGLIKGKYSEADNKKDESDNIMAGSLKYKLHKFINDPSYFGQENDKGCTIVITSEPVTFKTLEEERADFLDKIYSSLNLRKGSDYELLHLIQKAYLQLYSQVLDTLRTGVFLEDTKEIESRVRRKIEDIRKLSENI